MAYNYSHPLTKDEEVRKSLADYSKYNNAYKYAAVNKPINKQAESMWGSYALGFRGLEHLINNAGLQRGDSESFNKFYTNMISDGWQGTADSLVPMFYKARNNFTQNGRISEQQAIDEMNATLSPETLEGMRELYKNAQKARDAELLNREQEIVNELRKKYGMS